MKIFCNYPKLSSYRQIQYVPRFPRVRVDIRVAFGRGLEGPFGLPRFDFNTTLTRSINLECRVRFWYGAYKIIFTLLVSLVEHFIRLCDSKNLWMGGIFLPLSESTEDVTEENVFEKAISSLISVDTWGEVLKRWAVGTVSCGVFPHNCGGVLSKNSKSQFVYARYQEVWHPTFALVWE